MPYSVKSTAGNVVAVVPDRQIDTDATSLALVGFNATNYGLKHAENFIHLLENFANDTPPEHPMEGQFWFDANHDVMKYYSNGIWSEVSGTPSVSGGPNEGGLAAVYHYKIPTLATSILLVFAGGKIVAAVSSLDLVQSYLPASITINGTSYLLGSRFPLGLEAGVNLASDSADYMFQGKVMLAENAAFAGGGDANKPAGWAYLDLGAKSIGLMVSAGAIVCAISSQVVSVNELPAFMTVKVRKDDNTTESTVLQVSSVFPGGLFAGMTFSSGFSLSGTVTQAVVAQLITNESTSRATAIEELRVCVDANSATAQKVTSLEATFTSKTGTTSIASAIDTLIARASDTSASAAAITALKTEFTTSLGTTSFGEAMTKLSTISTGTGNNSEALTQIKSAFEKATGESNYANAIAKIWTAASADGPALSGYSLSLDSNGYVTGIEALNGGASNNFFKITSSKFIIGDNNVDFIPFQVVNGTVFMQNVVVDRLKVNTAIIPARSSASNSIQGTSRSTSGGGAPPTTIVLQATVVMPIAGWIEINFSAAQGFSESDGGTPWEFIARVNGIQLPESTVGGTRPGDSVSVLGQYYADTPGTYNVDILWGANNRVRLNGRSLFVKGYPATT